MRVTPEITAIILRLVTPPVDEIELPKYLIQHSNLPGPRANLELLDVVARASASRADLIPIYERWLGLPTVSNDPAEYLSTVAAAALGSIAIEFDSDTACIVNRLLRNAANDPRWRVREGVAMGLQRIGEADFDTLDALLSRWAIDATFMEQRAIAAALAHPPFLKSPGVAIQALAIMRPIALTIAGVDSATRKTIEFKTVEQGLSYTLSVVVTAAPEPGFGMLATLIDSGDKSLRAIIQENLIKKRLVGKFPS